MAALYIGDIAQRTGCSPKAVRLYESLGLLGKVVRRGAYRVYSEQQLRQVHLIRQAQALGFRLADLEPVMGHVDGGPDWLKLLDQIQARRQAVQAQASALQQQDRDLQAIHEEIRLCLMAELAATQAATAASSLAWANESIDSAT